MVYSLSYRRPGRVTLPDNASAVSNETKQETIRGSLTSGSSGMSNGIPEALSFDNIIAGGTCPVRLPATAAQAQPANRHQPCTVRDFMNFLKYIELSAENLQFFLWYRDYVRRFNALPESERVLSPEWTGETSHGNDIKPSPRVFAPEATDILKGTDFAADGRSGEVEKHATDPFNTPPRTPNSSDPRGAESVEFGDYARSTAKIDHAQRAAGAFEHAGLKWKPRE